MRFAVALCLLTLPAISSSPPSDARPPVILISIDTLRADHLGVYGFGGAPTPHIDSFAGHGTVFLQADSQIPLTLPSHTALFTSSYPFQTQVTENGEAVSSNSVTLASVLKEHGYATAAFIGSIILGNGCGLNKGFDTYDAAFAGNSERKLDPYSLRVRRIGALVTRSALTWLTALKDRPEFAFVHLYDLHTPYAAPQVADRGLPNEAGYDAEILYLDRVLGHFKETLATSGLWDRALIVVVSDHGESLGDHGETSHGYFAYESTLHVPLIIHWPASFGNFPNSVDAPAALIDVAPTILSFLHIPAPPSFQGVNLLDGSALVKRAVYGEAPYAHDAFRWAELQTLRSGNWKYIDAPHPELYNLAVDAGERRNLFATDTARARAMKSQLAMLTSAAAAQSHAAAAPSNSSALQSLGYIAHRSGSVSAGPEPDPKDRLPEFQAYETALTALTTGNNQTAVARFRGLLVKDPANSEARYQLGEAYARLGRSADAIREWRDTLTRDHAFIAAALSIGALYLAEHHPAQAREAFEAAVMMSPNDYEARQGLSIAERQLRELEKAKLQ